MANSFFDLFDFDFSEFSKLLDSWKVLATDKYNDFVNNKIKKYDLSTQEGYEAFINEAADIRTKLVESDSVFSKPLINWLDGIVKKAMQEHAEKETKKTVAQELVDAEVNRTKEENHGKLNTGKKDYEAPACECCKDTGEDEPAVWPSDYLTERQKRNVWRLVDEYMDEMVLPYLPKSTSEDAIDDMSNGLFEFASWILNRQED